MPIGSPRRLPRRFNRPTSRLTRSIAYKRSKPRRSAQYWRQFTRRFGRTALRSTHDIFRELKLWLIALGSGLLVLLLAILLFSPIFNVRQIEVLQQDARLDREQVQGMLSPLFKNRLLFVTRSQVQGMLTEQFPDITKVEISKKYPSSLSVLLSFDPLVGMLDIMAPQQGTGTTAARTSSGMNVYITSKGLVIFSRLKLAHTPLPSIVITDWGTMPENRTVILEPSSLKTIFLSRDTLKESFGLPVSRIVVYLRAREFHVQVGRVSLWFDMATPLGIQFGRFREFLKTESLDQAKEYIDLRISDRVMYK